MLPALDISETGISYATPKRKLSFKCIPNRVITDSLGLNVTPPQNLYCIPVRYLSLVELTPSLFTNKEGFRIILSLRSC